MKTMQKYAMARRPAAGSSAVADARGLLAACALVLLATFHPGASAQTGYGSQWSPSAPGVAYGLVGRLARVDGSALPYRDFTVGVLASARNDRDVHQWAFGVATEAWAMPGSRSTLVGLEAVVVNEEPQNHQPKIAANLIFKNRQDGAAAPDAAMNRDSIALWVSSQPGTGFERGLVFASGSLMGVKRPPAVLDLSDLSDDEIARVDLIRLRKDVVLRYDPVTRELAIVVETPGL